jgi:hypothetical protein
MYNLVRVLVSKQLANFADQYHSPTQDIRLWPCRVAGRCLRCSSHLSPHVRDRIKSAFFPLYAHRLG